MLDNIPDIRAGHRDIPPGKVLLSDNPPKDQPRVKRHTLDTRTAWGRTAVTLFAQTPGWACAGWACAGGMMRWDNGCFGYSYDVGGAQHGRSFKTLDEALAAFTSLPAA